MSLARCSSSDDRASRSLSLSCKQVKLKCVYFCPSLVTYSFTIFCRYLGSSNQLSCEIKRNIAWYLADEAVAKLAKISGNFARLSRITVLLFYTLITKHSFIIAKLKTIFILPFVTTTHEITEITGYVLTPDDECSVYYAWPYLGSVTMCWIIKCNVRDNVTWFERLDNPITAE